MLCKKLKDKKYVPLLISFLIGIMIGFMISPVKKGVAIFSYNGNHNGVSGKIQKNLDKLDD